MRSSGMYREGLAQPAWAQQCSDSAEVLQIPWSGKVGQPHKARELGWGVSAVWVDSM